MDMTNMTNLEAALHYAKNGFFIVLLQPNGKAPLLDGGHHSATCDKAVIEQWFTQCPSANLGINLKASGMVALDVDSYKPAFSADLPELGPGWMQTTANGGVHYIFSDKGLSYNGQLTLNGIIQDAIEIKHNGYIVLAPSKLGTKTYQAFNAGQVNDPPEWLIEGTRRRKVSYVSSGSQVASLAPHEVLETLSHINPDVAYRDWVRVLMAVHDATTGSEEGLQMAIAWSSKGTKFGQYEADNIARKWNGFSPGGGISFKTAKLMAECSKWGVSL